MKAPLSLRAPARTAATFVILAASAAAGTLTVTATSPVRQALTAPLDTDIVIDFDLPLAPVTVPPLSSKIAVFGVATGPASGTLTLENGNQRLRFAPDEPFSAGETVRVTMAQTVQANDGSFLQTGGYAFEFTTRTRPASMDFTELDVISVRTIPSSTTRLYGGQACDLDDDGHIDIVTVNEDTADLRVLMNNGGCDGLYDAFLTPTTSVGAVPSPNGAADFDRDGMIDVCTANASGASASVALGNGDGTFAASTTYGVGNGPHGLAVLDANGDGALDIATSNTGSSNVSLLLNNGSGGFGAASSFEGGGSGEYALGAGDMDGDGIYDLVVGARTSEQIIVHLGNGNGTFAAQPARPAGGSVWMLFLGDINGDGDLDVSTGNSSSSTGSILFGDGAGGLSAPTVYGAASQVVATDLGDLDGDGDLDWVLSAFGGGVYRVYVNNGSGVFSFDQQFTALSNASCAVPYDFDNDRDLDLALFDEVSDVVYLMENDADAGAVFCSGDGSGTACPCANAGLPCHGCEHSGGTGGVLLVTEDFAPNGVGGGTVDLVGQGFVPTAAPTVIAIRSTVKTSGGAGSVFGDGLMCVGPPTVRLTAGAASGGSASLALNHGAGAGTFHYQLWYRNTPAFCTANQFNLSNGLTLTWP